METFTIAYLRLILWLFNFCFVAGDNAEEYAPPQIKPILTLRLTDTFENDVENCTATGNPEPSYTWKFSSNESGPYSDILNTKYRHVEGRLLYLKNSRRNLGFYRCFATNKYGTDMSMAMEIQKQVIPRFSDLNIVHIEADTNKRQFIECRGKTAMYPIPIFQWRLKGSPLPPSKRYALDDEGNLYFIIVKIDDEHTNLKKEDMYRCHAHAYYPSPPFYGQGLGKTGSYVQLTVKYSTTRHRSPGIWYNSKNKTVLYGDAFMLTCIPDGVPIPEFKWKKDGVDISDTDDHFKIVLFTRSLNVSISRESDQGMYTCTLAKFPKFSRNIFVNVYSKPIVHYPEPSTKIMPIGSSMEFLCSGRTANVYSRVVQEWFKNGKKIDSLTVTTPHFVRHNNRIRLINVRYPDDIMNLACRLTNRYGTVFIPFAILVTRHLSTPVRPTEAISSFKYILMCNFGHFVHDMKQHAPTHPELIPPHLCTHITFHSAIVKYLKVVNGSKRDESFNGNFALGLYNRILYLKKGNPNLKILLALGTRKGTKDFYYAASSMDSREILATNALKYVKKWKFDGMVLEIPQYTNSYESSKFVLLCQKFKEVFDNEKTTTGSRLLLMASFHKKPIDGIAKYLDYVILKTYDYAEKWGVNTEAPPSIKTTHKAPLSSVKATVDSWLLLNEPPKDSQVIVELSTYGRTYTLRSSDTGVGAKILDHGTAGKYSASPGYLYYYEICYRLTREQWDEKWDGSESVPYAFKGDQWVSYDNVLSMKAKVEYVKSSNLAGVCIHEITQSDYVKLCGAEEYPLVRSIHQTLLGEDYRIYCWKPPYIPTPHLYATTRQHWATTRFQVEQAKSDTAPIVSFVTLRYKIVLLPLIFTCKICIL